MARWLGLLLCGVLIAGASRGVRAASPGDSFVDPSARAARWKAALDASAALSRGQPARAERALRRLRVLHRPAALRSAVALLQALRGDLRGGLVTLRSGAGTGGGWVESHYHEAVLCMHRGHLEAAARALHRAQTLGGDRPRYSLLDALLSLRRGRTGAARRAVERLARTQCDLLDPTIYPDPVVELVRALSRMLRDFVQPADAEATLGTVLFSLRRYRAAEVMFRRALQRVHGHGASLLGMARVRLIWGDAPGALRYASRAVAQAPRAAAAYAQRAEVYLVLGRTGPALADLRRAVRLDPRDAMSLSRLAGLLWKQGAYARAERTYRYALKQSARLASARFGLARALAQRGEHAEALRSFRAAAALNPARPAYLLALGVALARAGKHQEAAKARAQAQAAARLVEQFGRQVRAALAVGSVTRRACRVASAGAPAAARALLRTARVPGAVAALLRAYVAHRAGRRAPQEIGRVLAGLLRPARLLGRGQTVPRRIVVSGRVAPGVPARLERYLPFLDPAWFR